jgi:hypothetical protein
MTRQILPLVLLVLGPFAAVRAMAMAADQVPVPIAERARGAERVVAGRVGSVTPEWQTNEYGDRLIVSVVRVNVTETMKGESSPTVDVEVEGGTIGTLTLRVSDQLTLTQTSCSGMGPSDSSRARAAARAAFTSKTSPHTSSAMRSAWDTRRRRLPRCTPGPSPATRVSGRSTPTIYPACEPFIRRYYPHCRQLGSESSGSVAAQPGSRFRPAIRAH